MEEGGKPPLGWGVCWHTWSLTNETPTAVAPIPLNLILKLGRAIWLWFAVGRWPYVEDKFISNAMKRAHAQGYKDAVNAIYAFVLDETLTRDLEKFKREKDLE